MSRGYVYILTNPSMPGLVKIGRTARDPNSRAMELYQTGVPEPFVVEFAQFSPDCHELENKCHLIFATRRVNVGREFFKASVAAARDAVRGVFVEQMRELVWEFDGGLTLLADRKVVDAKDADYIDAILSDDNARIDEQFDIRFPELREDSEVEGNA